MPSVITVNQLNTYVKSLLESDIHLSSFYLKGEISNFKDHYSSGHLYFSLKDENAVVKAVMFRSSAMYLKFKPCDGMSVICRGRVSLYERDGSYQFYVEEMTPEGVGDLTTAFLQIKEELAQKGYFDTEHKKAIPAFPKKIAVITSNTGAAIEDILNITSRRYPICEILICPVNVQGENAVGDMLISLSALSLRNDIDTVIIGRGGGSIEDLWAYNSPLLAEAIYNFPIPIISAVGHETDFTICDFVSDLRAPTPSAAAELAVPDITEIKMRIGEYDRFLLKSIQNKITFLQNKLDVLIKGTPISQKFKFFDEKFIYIDSLKEKLSTTYLRMIDSKISSFKENTAKLNSLSPLSVLSRGFSIASDFDGKLISSENISVGKKFTLKYRDGSACCSVEDIFEE